MRGILTKLKASARQEGNRRVVSYELCLGGETRALGPALGRGLILRFTGRSVCSGCGADTKRLYGGPHCYRCFTTLARCDLCVVSPARCHYAEGTCREPEWGEAFCMQPHCVYLANTSGPKVGITGRDREIGRWIDQGAVQGVVVADAATRKDAGHLEAELARRISDRTDWKRLVSGAPRDLDLAGLAAQLRREAGDVAGTGWRTSLEPVTLEYPVAGHSPPVRLKVDETQPEIRDNLVGIKGQFLLLTQGAFSVTEHGGREVEVDITDAFAVGSLSQTDQLELF